MSGKRLYFLILGSAIAGIAWIFLNLILKTDIRLCLFRQVTGIPCPSCGITGTILWLFGVRSNIFIFNVLGLLMIPVIVVFPVWIIIDLIIGKETFLIFYKKTESILRNRYIAIILIIFMLMIWAGNVVQILR